MLTSEDISSNISIVIYSLSDDYLDNLYHIKQIVLYLSLIKSLNSLLKCNYLHNFHTDGCFGR